MKVQFGIHVFDSKGFSGREKIEKSRKFRGLA
jgi:hypothetical protein